MTAVAQLVDLDFSTSAIQAALNSIIAAMPSLQASKVQAAGAIPAHATANYKVTAGSAQAMTLAAPVAVTEDGNRITVRSTSAFAHTITATGLLQTGSANVNVATFAAFAGAGLTLEAFNGKWIVVDQVGITFT